MNLKILKSTALLLLLTGHGKADTALTISQPELDHILGFKCPREVSLDDLSTQSQGRLKNFEPSGGGYEKNLNKLMLHTQGKDMRIPLHASPEIGGEYRKEGDFIGFFCSYQTKDSHGNLINLTVRANWKTPLTSVLVKNASNEAVQVLFLPELQDSNKKIERESTLLKPEKFQPLLKVKVNSTANSRFTFLGAEISSREKESGVSPSQGFKAVIYLGDGKKLTECTYSRQGGPVKLEIANKTCEISKANESEFPQQKAKKKSRFSSEPGN